MNHQMIGIGRLVVSIIAAAYFIGFVGTFTVAISPLSNKQLTTFQKNGWTAALIILAFLTILLPMLIDVPPVAGLVLFPLFMIYVFFSEPRRKVKVIGIMTVIAFGIGIFGQMKLDGRM